MTGIYNFLAIWTKLHRGHTS